MSLRAEVLKAARLARLALPPEAEERLAGQLERVLDYVKQLDEVHELAEELTHVAVVDAPPRADEPRPGLAREVVLRLAPRSDGETMQVPAVIDAEGGA